MSSIAVRRSVLVVGGGGKAPPADGAALPPEVKAKATKPEDLKKVLGAMIQQADSQGFDVKMMQLADAEAGDAWLKDVGDTLASRSWDGFIIGNGIRGTPSLTLIFERLVGLGREKAPSARMGFNTHPMDIIETMQRMFPS